MYRASLRYCLIFCYCLHELIGQGILDTLYIIFYLKETFRYMYIAQVPNSLKCNRHRYTDRHKVRQTSKDPSSRPTCLLRSCQNSSYLVITRLQGRSILLRGRGQANNRILFKGYSFNIKHLIGSL